MTVRILAVGKTIALQDNGIRGAAVFVMTDQSTTKLPIPFPQQIPINVNH